MTEIYIQNNQNEIEISTEIENVIKCSIDEVMAYEDCKFDAEVSVIIVDEEEMRQLNSEHRQKDSPTDVLSFPILEFDDDLNIVNSDFDFNDELVMLGDIVICAKRAMAQANEYGHSFIREIAFLTVHSMLHLLGYDHEHNEDEEQLMFKKQKEVLDKMGVTRNV
ncbi:MAG: rRNA maturation RNase YbeY [Clostridia bacterium]|nr:rRNA maturation RNase YbeY [Clostridia bacterium]